MSRHRIAIIGLGMAVTPHAKSLLDLADRVEVAYCDDAERGAPRGIFQPLFLSHHRQPAARSWMTAASPLPPC